MDSVKVTDNSIIESLLHVVDGLWSHFTDSALQLVTTLGN